MTAPTLILASASPYKRALLARLGLAFESHDPAIDEQARAEELPIETAKRLALAKAEALQAHHPDAWIIGCDQVADLDGQLLGKPGDRERAIKQLQQSSGRCVGFHSAVALLTPKTRDCKVSSTEVQFRNLSATQIENYVAKEPALDCAGSFKAESLGIALFEELKSGDPTSLIGLPLITVRQMLSAAGLEVLAAD